MQKRLITAADIREASLSGKKSLEVSSGECIVTPMAMDEAEALHVAIHCISPAAKPSCDCPTLTSTETSDALVRTVSDLMQARGASRAPAHQLEAIVRDVVAAKLKTGAGQPAEIQQGQDKNNQGIRIINGKNLLDTHSGGVSVSEKAWVANPVGGEAGEKLAGGLMAWENATFSRRVEAPEIAVIIDGELHLIVDGETMVAKTGDMIYLPQGVAVDFHAPATVKLACVNCVS